MDNRNAIFSGSGRVLGLGLVCALALLLFILSNTNGDLGIFNDDIFFIHYTKVEHGYFGKIVGRGFLTPYYRWIYELAGQSDRVAHLVNFGLYGVSVLFCLAASVRLFGKNVALLPTLLYLAWAGKYDLLTANSVGAYILVACGLFSSVWIALETCMPLWIRAALVALLNWLVAHLCEILIVVMPLYPLFYAWHRWRKKEPVQCAGLAATFLPLAVFLVHWFLIWWNTPPTLDPIWVRQPGASREPLYLLYMLGYAFWAGVQASFGLEHVKLVTSAIAGFSRGYIPVTGWMVATLALSVTLLVALLRQLRDARTPLLEKSRAGMILAAALYLVFVAPLVGFTLLTPGQLMPSRLLLLPCVGLCLLAGLAAQWALQQDKWKNAVLAGLGLYIFLEGLALHSIVAEFQASWAYDRKIREQIQAYGIKPRMGDTIFVSLPPNAWFRHWKRSPSEFESGAAQSLLLMDHDMVKMVTPVPCHERLFYRKEVRPADAAPMNLAIENDWESGKRGFFAFRVSGDDLQVDAVRELQIIDGENHVLREVRLPSFDSLPQDKAIVGKVNAVFLSHPYVKEQQELRLNYFDPTFKLRLAGRMKEKGALGMAQLRRGNQVIASLSVGQTERFVWDVPLKQITESREVISVRLERDVNSHKQATCIIDEFFLIKDGKIP
jgi:hypothetical protein